MDINKKELYTATRTSGVNVSDPSISELWNAVKSNDSALNFLLLKYTSANNIGAFSHGDGGLNQLLTMLSDDDVYFGGLRVEIQGIVKYFVLYFVGSSVGGMKKGKASLHKAAVFNELGGTHGEITCVN
eukprot:gene59961-79962_t